MKLATININKALKAEFLSQNFHKIQMQKSLIPRAPAWASRLDTATGSPACRPRASAASAVKPDPHGCPGSFTSLPTIIIIYCWSALLARNHYCQQLTVCLSRCQSVSVTPLQIASFLFLDGIEPFLGCQFSMTPSTKRFSSISDLGPLMPKIYSSKFAQNRL